MKVAHLFDEEGFYTNDMIVHSIEIEETGEIIYILPENATWADLPSPIDKPKWNGSVWEETGNPQIIESPGISDTDKIRQTVADLTQQLILNGVI